MIDENDNFMEIGREYLYNYEDKKNTRWKCIGIENGWAILHRPSVDYKGDYLHSTTSLEASKAKGCMVKFPKRSFVYIDIDSPEFIFGLESSKDFIQFRMITNPALYNEHQYAKVEMDETGLITKISYN